MSHATRRMAACAGAAAFALAQGAHAAPASASDPHTLALTTLHDLRAAVASIVAAEAATSSGPAEYRHDAQRAINALAGAHGDGYVAGAGSAGDADGVLGHVDTLLDRADSPPWVPAIHGVQANARAALGSLDDAVQARGLDDFEVDVSRALLNLQVAIGRASEPDVLGGLLGAMASTALGVPPQARLRDACSRPVRPGYGMHDGYWVWRAVRLRGDTQSLPDFGATTLRRKGNMLILYTPAAQIPQARCAAHASANPTSSRASWRGAPVTAQRPPALYRQASYRAASMSAAPAPIAAVWHPRQPSAALLRTALSSGDSPPYTAAQARAGKPIYDQHCASCHGARLQGVAAPAIAGHDFVSTAQKNHWSVGVLRTIVTENMPFNDPGSLDPKQYAQVIAYLLASNCYTAGSTPFPLHHSAKLDKMQLPDPPQAAHADAAGVCMP